MVWSGILASLRGLLWSEQRWHGVAGDAPATVRAGGVRSLRGGQFIHLSGYPVWPALSELSPASAVTGRWTLLFDLGDEHIANHDLRETFRELHDVVPHP